MVAVEPQHNTVVTPSGIEVLYQWEPKRLYRVRPPHGANFTPFLEGEGWVEVPSVTTVLGCLDKPALPWWGMKTGVEGVIRLHNLGLLHTHKMEHQQILVYAGQDGVYHAAGAEQVVDLLNAHKLTVNHVRDKAGDRGNAVHDALEVWADTGVLPDPEMFPPAEQGYVVGLIAFLEHLRPEPVASEVMVGSVEHGFAGRYDLRIRTDEERQVVVHRTPVKGPQWATVPAGLFTIDLKTSSGVYPTHAIQLEAYELASVECGYEPTDARGILHVGPNGTYEFVRSWATGDDFLAVLGAHNALEAMKERRKKNGRS